MPIRTYNIVIYDRLNKKYLRKEILLPISETIIGDINKVHEFSIRIYDGGCGYKDYSFPLDRFNIVELYPNDNQVEV